MHFVNSIEASYKIISKVSDKNVRTHWLRGAIKHYKCKWLAQIGTCVQEYIFDSQNFPYHVSNFIYISNFIYKWNGKPFSAPASWSTKSKFHRFKGKNSEQRPGLAICARTCANQRAMDLAFLFAPSGREKYSLLSTPFVLHYGIVRTG